MTISSFQNDTKIQSSRVYGLDVFRAVAILFVLIGHTLEHSKVPPEIKVFGSLGILGVELFFVLSGFLIGSIIIKLIEQNRFHSITAIVAFWKRRWLRTLPMYFVALLAFIRFDYHGRHDLLDYPTYFIFMQNFAYKIPDFFELSWSLAIEEHFYLWFPLVFLVLTRVTKRAYWAILFSAFVFISIGYIYRLSLPLYSNWNDYAFAIRLTVMSRLDAIMFGVIIATIKYYWASAFDWIRAATPITATLFVLLCTWWFAKAPYLMQSRLLQINLFTGQAIICCLLLPYFDGLRSRGGLNKFFTITSKLSYSLYLIHILIIIAVNRVLMFSGKFDQIYENPFIIYPIYFSLFYLASWFTYNQIERPFLLLRDEKATWPIIAQSSWVTILLSASIIIFF